LQRPQRLRRLGPAAAVHGRPGRRHRRGRPPGRRLRRLRRGAQGHRSGLDRGARRSVDLPVPEPARRLGGGLAAARAPGLLGRPRRPAQSATPPTSRPTPYVTTIASAPPITLRRTALARAASPIRALAPPVRARD